jgi:hypothetical protein
MHLKEARNEISIRHNISLCNTYSSTNHDCNYQLNWNIIRWCFVFPNAYNKFFLERDKIYLILNCFFLKSAPHGVLGLSSLFLSLKNIEK